MKLFAQVGHGPGEKITVGLRENLIQGAIFSPKDMSKESIAGRFSEIRRNYPDADILIDPQFYASLHADSPLINIGNLSDWNSFRHYRKGELEINKNIDLVLEAYFRDLATIEVTGIIAPNIYISQSFDSREAVIAKNFIRQARHACKTTKLPLYASLVICREALQDNKEFEEFINDITVLDDRPDGFYIIVGSRSSNARSDIYHTDIIANWMMLNLSLSINGFQVINGYSDIMTPFLGAAGGAAGATGWWSNLRMFSLDRFFPAGGGRLPIVRYLSKLLLNRITFSEKDAISLFVPEIANNLPHDSEYTPEPERAREVLQSWEALSSLIEELVNEDISDSLTKCEKAVRLAEDAYSQIAANGKLLDHKSNDEHILPLIEGLKKFREKAEL